MRLRAKIYSVLSVDLKEKKKALDVFKVGSVFYRIFISVDLHLLDP